MEGQTQQFVVYDEAAEMERASREHAELVAQKAELDRARAEILAEMKQRDVEVERMLKEMRVEVDKRNTILDAGIMDVDAWRKQMGYDDSAKKPDPPVKPTTPEEAIRVMDDAVLVYELTRFNRDDLPF